MATNKTTIDEFVTRIKNNTPLVYEKGKTKGVEEGYDNGLDAAITVHEEFLADKPKTYYDAFWDVYQQNGNNTNYLYRFSYSGWNSDTTYNPKYPIVIRGTNTCTNMYAYSGVTDTKVDITFTKTSGTSSAYNFLNNATNMVTVRKVTFNDATTFNNASFQNCTKLETMNVEGVIGQNGLNLQWSTLLNKASIESIINALSTTTEGLAITLSEIAVDNAFETVKGAADGSTSAEWIALAGDENTEGIRPKWTINLVR